MQTAPGGTVSNPRPPTLTTLPAHDESLALPSNSFREAWMLGGVGVMLALIIQVALFDNIPHVTDSISHMFQAKLFAEGHLTAPLPPCHASFFQHHLAMTYDGRWFTKYTPGHPLLLAAGLRAHVVWLICPLAHGLCVFFLYGLARRFWSVRMARPAAVLFCFSPLALLLGASFMSHATFLAAALGGGYFLVKGWSHPGVIQHRSCVAAGLMLGYAAIIRPQDAVLAFALIGLAILMAGPPTWRKLLPSAPSFVGGMAIPVLILLMWNREIYGRYLALGYGFTQSGFIYPMFQAVYGFTDQFTLRKAMQQTIYSLYRLDQVALGWPLTLPLLLPVLWIRPLRRPDLYSLAGLFAVIGMYFPYNYYAIEFEARYYYPALPFVLVLLVRAGQILTHASTTMLQRTRMAARAKATILGTTWVFCATMSLYAFAYYWPQKIWPVYHRDYEQASPHLHQWAQRASLGHALVLINSQGEDGFRYSSGMVYNDPFLRNTIIYARDPGMDTQCLETSFPDRVLYRVIPEAGWTTARFVRVQSAKR